MDIDPKIEKEEGIIPKKPYFISINRDWAWKLILAIVSLCILGYGILFSKNKVASIFSLMGGYLLYSIILTSIISYLVAGRKKSRDALVSFLVIYVSFIFSGYLSAIRWKGELIRVVNEFENRFEKSTAPSLSSNNYPKISEERDSVASRSDKLLSETERFFTGSIDRWELVRKDYLLAFDSIGWANIVSPSRIQNDTEFIESKLMINMAKEIVSKYESLFYRLVDDNYSSIDNLDIDEKYKYDIKRGLNISTAISRPMQKRVWFLELNCVLEYEKMLNYLKEHKNAWLISNDQIVFYHDDNLRYFNKYLSNIQNIVKEEKLFQQKIIDYKRQEIKNLKDILK